MKKVSRIILIGIITLGVLLALSSEVLAENATATDEKSKIELIQIIGGVVQLLLGIALALAAIYIGLKVLDKMTPNLPMWEEIKKKNMAVGITAAAVVVSIAACIGNGLAKFADGFKGGELDWVLIGGACATVVVGLLFGIIGIWIALKVLDRLTPDIPLEETLKKGNLAWGILVAGVLYAIASVISLAVGGIATGFGL